MGRGWCESDAVSTPLAGQGPALLAVAAGGAAGALARYGAGVLWSPGPAAFPATTFLVNAVGCLLVGVLVVLVGERPGAHPLLRPLLVTGVLGGFTTFSAYATDVLVLVARERWLPAAAYLVATPALGLLAAWTGLALTRTALGRSTP